MRDRDAPQLRARGVRLGEALQLAGGDAERGQGGTGGGRAASVDVERGQATGDGGDGDDAAVRGRDPLLLHAIVIPGGNDAADAEADEILDVERNGRAE